MNKITIKGVEYVLFSVDRAEYGGISKKDAIELLKGKGIKVSINRERCYTPYVGQYALLIEASREDEASDLLF